MAVYYRTPHVVADDVSFTDKTINRGISDVLQEYAVEHSINEAIRRIVSVSDYYLPIKATIVAIKAILGEIE